MPRSWLRRRRSAWPCWLTLRRHDVGPYVEIHNGVRYEWQRCLRCGAKWLVRITPDERA